MANIFNLMRDKHADQSAVDQEFGHILRQLQGFITYTDQRAPGAGDKGLFWLYKQASKVDMYVRDIQGGTWRGPVSFT